VDTNPCEEELAPGSHQRICQFARFVKIVCGLYLNNTYYPRHRARLHHESDGQKAIEIATKSFCAENHILPKDVGTIDWRRHREGEGA
jgi:hypothetical protein